MLRPMRILSALLALTLLCQCHALRHLGKSNKDASATTDDDAPHVLGTIEMVHPESNFVIARLSTNYALEPGIELFCNDTSGKISKLKLNPERKGVLVTADIVSGQPVKGGVLFIGKVPGKASPQPTPGPPSAVNPPGGISIAPGALGAPKSAPPPPVNNLPDSVAPSDSAADFLRIVPKQ